MAEPVPLLRDISPPGNSFVLPEHRVVYISVTKVACTSLRWMVADLAGEDLESFHHALPPHQSRLMTVHRFRTFWKRTPQLFQLSPEELAEISRDQGWFVFAMVRDPRSRLWSAWQSKFLVGNPFYVADYGDQPWFPRPPESQQQVVEDFARFVHAKPWTTHPQLSTDVHFLPQARSVRPEGVNYTKIYDLTEFSEMLRDLKVHLASLGRDQELYVPRANETPLPLIPAVLGDGVGAAIEAAYAEDFAAFGHRWHLDGVRTKGESWSSEALRIVECQIEANQRIGDLSTAAMALRDELKQARREIRQLTSQQAVTRPAGRPLPVRLTRRARRLLSRG